jgi:signal peptidase I
VIARRSPLWREMPSLLVTAVLVAIVVRVFLIQTYYIPSGSMEHTLDLDDRVVVDKVGYDVRPPHRGEVIVFRSPLAWRYDPHDKDFIKRVIGTGGDRVMCCDAGHRLVVNGHPLDESGYLYRGSDGRQDPPSSAPFDVRVPAGRLWVMGDHRSVSGDSRARYLQTGDTVGSTIAVGSVEGHAVASFWPFGRARWLSVPATFDGVPPPRRDS